MRKKGLPENYRQPFGLFSVLVVPGAGIEPARYIIPRDFKSLASTCSAIRAYFREPLFFSEGKLEAPPGFEPGMEVLQTSALPLGDGAKKNQPMMLIYSDDKRDGAGNGI